MKIKFSQISTVAILVLVTVIALCSSQLVESVNKGQFHVIQIPVTGTIQVHRTEGVYPQWGASVDVWNNTQMAYFTADQDTTDDVDEDTSIRVEYDDGFVSNISSTMMVSPPLTDADLLKMIREKSIFTNKDVEIKLVRPYIRKVLRITASLVSAEYTVTGKSILEGMVMDQIENGPYKTETYEVEEWDPSSGSNVMKTKVKVLTINGEKQYHPSNIQEFGIEISQFEIKDYGLEEKAQIHIEAQRELKMGVVTAKAEAEKAKQDAIAAEEQGKIAVTKAQYEEKTAAIREVEKAEKEEEMALIEARKEKAVALEQKEKAETEAAARAEVLIIEAEAAKQAAELTAEAVRVEAEAKKDAALAEAEGKEAIMAADGALQQKLDAYVKANQAWADASSKRAVPATVIGGQLNDHGQVGATSMDMQDSMNLLLMRELGVNLNMKQGGLTPAFQPSSERK